jgi:hypothetical protein
MADLHERKTRTSFTSSNGAKENEADDNLEKIEIPREKDITRMVFGI